MRLGLSLEWIEAKKHFVSVATMRSGYWSFGSKAGVWMRPERQQEVQVLAKQTGRSEPNFSLETRLR
jgi:hypothetical protein